MKHTDEVVEKEVTRAVIAACKEHYSITVAVKDIMKLIATAQSAKVEELHNALYALGSMYLQYVSEDGHLFLSAGENAQEVLEHHGLLSADATGRGEPDWGKLEALLSPTPAETPYNQRDHRHCTDTNSPCGFEGKHRCCLCGVDVTSDKK